MLPERLTYSVHGTLRDTFRLYQLAESRDFKHDLGSRGEVNSYEFDYQSLYQMLQYACCLI